MVLQTKHEWRKAEKMLYLPKNKPELVTVAPQKFIAVTGQGDPNGAEFAAKTEILYTLAYAVRMLPKSGFTPQGYFEYTVYPLEGLWASASNDVTDKSAFEYEIMIRQPNFVTTDVFNTARQTAAQKKPGLNFDQTRFKTITDGLCVQMLHTGAYDDEPASFAQMEAFARAQNLTRTGKIHREIYLSDPRKVAPAQLKTVLRFSVTQT